MLDDGAALAARPFDLKLDVSISLLAPGIARCFYNAFVAL